MRTQHKGIVKLSGGFYLVPPKGSLDFQGPFEKIEEALEARRKRDGEKIKAASKAQRVKHALPRGVYLGSTGNIRCRVTLSGVTKSYGPFDTVEEAVLYRDLLRDAHKREKWSQRMKQLAGEAS